MSKKNFVQMRHKHIRKQMIVNIKEKNYNNITLHNIIKAFTNEYFNLHCHE